MRTIKWQDGNVVTIDQTRLPLETVNLKIKTVNEMAEAIRNLRVRGAPLLGASAAFGLALAACRSKASRVSELLQDLEEAALILKKTRPTAVNLFWAVDRVLGRSRNFSGNIRGLKDLVIREAQKIADEDAEANRVMGEKGAALINDGDVILTHCNAGELATVEYGTAIGVIRAAWKQGKKISVIATETRPLLQGARLTVYELMRDGIPVKLITDSMVGYVMSKSMVDKVIVGADRIVRDGVANKIGTLTIAVIAFENGVPFYVAAPKSTFDLSQKSADIIIEQRTPTEVTYYGGRRISVEGVDVLNPAFDVTPLKYVSAIIHENGIYFKRDFAKF